MLDGFGKFYGENKERVKVIAHFKNWRGHGSSLEYDLMLLPDGTEVPANLEGEEKIEWEADAYLSALRVMEEEAKQKRIVVVADFQSALHGDGDGNLDPDGHFVWDEGQEQNEECYAQDPCPLCGDGCIFGADFPNGEGEGTCLKCHTEVAWDNEEGEWRIEE